MPRELITDWKRIGQSGHTRDGRKIEASWLVEAAETYDPEHYCALIWWEHYRWLGNLGKVVELRTEKNGDETTLLAKVSPNQRLIDLNKEDQKLFSSMELEPNFAESGKFYLSGLGATDEPASLGTEELKFSNRKQSPENIFSIPLETNFNVDNLDSDSEKNLFARIAKTFGLTPKNQTQDENEMTPEMFKEMKTLFSNQTAAITSLANEVKSFSKNNVSNESGGEDNEQNGSEQNNAETANFSNIEKSLNEMTQAFTALSSKVSDALGETEGTETPEHNGSSTEERVL